MIDFSMRDTIAAPATATGQAGIGIIRMSGRQAEEILKLLFVPLKASFPLEDRRLYLGSLVVQGEMIDEWKEDQVVQRGRFYCNRPRCNTYASMCQASQ